MKTLTPFVGALSVMLTCAMGQAHASESIVPDFMPRSALSFTDEQLSLIKQHDSEMRVEGSKWNDIKGWRALGSRWAAALDAKGQVLGLYDLSLPASILPGFGLELGKIGGPDFTLKHVRELLNTARQKNTDKEQQDQLDEAIADIDKDPAKAENGLLADDWYKSVPWTKKAIRSFGVAAVDSMDAAPQSFTLADIDYKKATISHGLFKKSLKYLSRFGVDLSQLELIRQADGSYSMHVKADPAELDGSKVPHPAKLADSHDVLEGFWWSVERSAAKMVLGFAIDQIPNTVVAAVVSTVVNEYLTLRFDIYEYHREAAAEMVQAAWYGEAPYNSFSTLTHAELQNFGTSIYLAQFSLSSVWNWIIKWSGTKAWTDDMASDVQHEADARAFLNTHGFQYTDLNPRYSLSTGENEHKIFLIAKGRVFKSQEPFVAVNYDRPNNQTLIMGSVEAATVIVHFACHFIPTVGSVIPTLWDWTVRDEFQGIKYSEARLIAHLEDRELVSHENWDSEISVMLKQEINPFDIQPAQARDYVAKVAAELHIDRSDVGRRDPMPHDLQ